MEKTEPRNEFFAELKRIRESKGLRLEDISRRYRIRHSFLESIESGSFENLPEPVYTKTFISTYAGLLGVDAGPILVQYAQYVEQAMPVTPPEEHKREAWKPDSGKAVLVWLGSKGRKAGWIALVLAVIAVLGIYALQDRPDKSGPARTAAREEVKLPERPAPAAPVRQPELTTPRQGQQTVAPDQEKPAAPLPAKQKEPRPAASPAAGSLSLTIEATEAAWVQVKADKAPPVQRLLQAGEKVRAEAKERISVDIGNAGGVQITFQGQSLGSPGKRGEVVHLVYPEGKRIERKKPEEPKPAAGIETKPSAEQ